MRLKIFLLSTLWFLNALNAEAKLNVVTTVTDLKSLVELVGKNHVEVQSIAKGTQDPHFIDAKPSYMSRVANADLVVSIGLGLEDAWLNNVLHGARNPKVNKGSKGSLIVGPLVNPEEIPSGSQLSRREGDVHPEGNPHVTLDPIRMTKIAELVKDKLIDLDVASKADYEKNCAEVVKKLNDKTEEWKKRVKKTNLKSVVTYHKTLNYFLKRMGVEQATELEPKPGIAPSVTYLISVIDTMKNKNINSILIENFYDPTIAKKLKDLNPKLKVEIVPVSVEGSEKIKTLFDLYEALVGAIEKV